MTNWYRYIVRTASAHMPTSVRHPYIRVGVLELAHADIEPSSIRHVKGKVRVVDTWEARCVGKTERSASKIAIREAEALARSRNSIDWGVPI